MADDDKKAGDSTSKKFVITNPGQAPRTIYDANTQAVRIEPRGGVRRNVVLSQVTADELRERAGGDGGDTELQIEDQRGDGADQGGIKPKAKAARSRDDGSSSDDAATKKRVDDASRLVQRADAMDEKDFMTQAKATLGKDYPKGNPSREDVKKALGEVR